MLARILGSAAGGGFPQWNCNCPTCEARADRCAPGDRAHAVLDRGPRPSRAVVPGQRLARPAAPARTARPPTRAGVRATPIAGVLLTDAEIDHTAGLLLLRESNVPLEIYSSGAVRDALTDGYPVLHDARALLRRRAGRRSSRAHATRLAGSSLEVEAFPDRRRRAALPRRDAEGPGRSASTFRDSEGSGILTYAPALAALDDRRADAPRRQRLRPRRRDVLARRRARRARDQRPAPRARWATSPLDGERRQPRRARGARAPVRSSCTSTTRTRSCSTTRPSARQVDARGVEVGVDGMEIELDHEPTPWTERGAHRARSARRARATTTCTRSTCG